LRVKMLGQSWISTVGYFLKCLLFGNILK
jgi:hypothetical protein